MEPGLRDREYQADPPPHDPGRHAAMEPGLRDREYQQGHEAADSVRRAAMEPGLRDREYRSLRAFALSPIERLQWSPVLETGNTPAAGGA